MLSKVLRLHKVRHRDSGHSTERENRDKYLCIQDNWKSNKTSVLKRELKARTATRIIKYKVQYQINSEIPPLDALVSHNPTAMAAGKEPPVNKML